MCWLFQRVLEKAKDILLWGSTPDAVLRLYETEQEMFSKIYLQEYFTDQCHDSLSDFLQYRESHDEFGGKFIQVYFHSVYLFFYSRYLYLKSYFYQKFSVFYR